MKKREKVALFPCQAKREHSRLPPQELCPPGGRVKRFIVRAHSLGVGNKSQSSEGLVVFFFLQNVKMVTAGIRQLGNWDWSFPNLLCCDLLY